MLLEDITQPTTEGCLVENLQPFHKKLGYKTAARLSSGNQH